MHRNDQSLGPYTYEELIHFGITYNSLIWREGLPSWTVAGEVEELKIFFKPSFPPEPPYAAQIPTSYYIEPQKKQKPNLIKYLAIGVLALIVLMVGVSWLVSVSVGSYSPSYSSAALATLTPPTDWKDKIILNVSSFSIELGGIRDVKISVTNLLPVTIDKLVVKIYYVKANGGVFKTEYVEFKSISPATQSFGSAPDSNRGIELEKEISSVKINEYGIDE